MIYPEKEEFSVAEIMTFGIMIENYMKEKNINSVELLTEEQSNELYDRIRKMQEKIPV